MMMLPLLLIVALKSLLRFEATESEVSTKLPRNIIYVYIFLKKDEKKRNEKIIIFFSHDIFFGHEYFVCAFAQNLAACMLLLRMCVCSSIKFVRDTRGP